MIVGFFWWHDMFKKTMKRASASLDQSHAVDCKNLKYQTLLKEYLELQKEYVSQKRKLQAAKQRKEAVLAEVRFLRQRRKFLVKVSECNVEDHIHKPNSDLQSNALEWETNQAMTESIDQVPIKKSFVKNEGGKRRDLGGTKNCIKSLNSSVHDKGMGKRTITWPSQVTMKSNSIAFG